MRKDILLYILKGRAGVKMRELIDAAIRRVRLFIRLTLVLSSGLVLCLSPVAQAYPGRGQNAGIDARVEKLEKSLAQGWNTWDTYSVMSHDLLPEGVAVNLRLIDPSTGAALANPAMESKGSAVSIRPGIHTFNGSYTDMIISWHGIGCRVQSAHAGRDELILVTPEASSGPPGKIGLEVKMLWGRPGVVSLKNGRFLRFGCRKDHQDISGGGRQKYS